MARTKKEEVITEEIKETNAESTPESNEITDTQGLITETISDVIPEFADTKLKMYPNYKELYIDNKGGVYTSKDQSSKDSILYKNPYYKL